MTPTILFCDATEDQLKNVKSILLCFEVVSGLQVNFFKNEIIGVRLDDFQL